MERVTLAQSLALVALADLCGAVLVLVVLFGRREPQHPLQKRPLLPGVPLSSALERAIHHTLTQYDGADNV